MVEGTALVLVAAIAIDENIATERILVLYELSVSEREPCDAGENRPRPLDLGEPTWRRRSFGGYRVAAMVGARSIQGDGALVDSTMSKRQSSVSSRKKKG
jgi:hypothetical protein